MPTTKTTSRRGSRERDQLRPFIVPRLLRRTEAAAYLSVSPAQLDSLRARGDVRAVHVPSDRNPDGRCRVPLFDRTDLDAAIEKWKQATDA